MKKGLWLCVVLCCGVVCGVVWCVVLCCVVLCCALCCVVLCYVVLCCVVLCCVLSVGECVVLCCVVLGCAGLCCVVLCCAVVLCCLLDTLLSSKHDGHIYALIRQYVCAVCGVYVLLQTLFSVLFSSTRQKVYVHSLIFIQNKLCTTHATGLLCVCVLYLWWDDPACIQFKVKRISVCVCVCVCVMCV